MEPFIGLIPAIKKSYSLIFRNENLGFLIKSAITGFFISMLIMLPMMIVIFVIDAGITGSAIKPGEINRTINLNNQTLETSASPELLTTNGTYSRSTDTFSHPSTPGLAYAANVMAMVVLLLLFIPLSIVVSGFSVSFLMVSIIKTYEGNFVSMKELIKTAFRKMWTVAAVLFIQALISLTGLLLFIIPAIIFGIMFMFAPYIAVGENCGVFEALKKSKNLTSGYKLNLFKKGFGFTALIFLFAIPLGIFIVVSMYAGFSSVFSYLFSFFQNMLFVIMYKDLMRIKAAPAEGAVTVTAPAPTDPTPPTANEPTQEPASGESISANGESTPAITS